MFGDFTFSECLSRRVQHSHKFTILLVVKLSQYAFEEISNVQKLKEIS